jgi:DNA repair protein RecO (recombination protein O)
MRNRGYSSEGIVVSKKNHGEADRILVVYSKNFGLLRLMAKGVRKPKSRKRGHLEVFSHVKFSASVGNGMDMVTEAEAIDSFDEIRKELKKMTVGYYLCEVLGRLTREGEKNEKIFSLALLFLNNLKNSENLKKLRIQFATDMLVTLGFWSAANNLVDPDKMLEEVTERRVNSIRVGKALLI